MFNIIREKLLWLLSDKAGYDSSFLVSYTHFRNQQNSRRLLALCSAVLFFGAGMLIFFAFAVFPSAAPASDFQNNLTYLLICLQLASLAYLLGFFFIQKGASRQRWQRMGRLNWALMVLIFVIMGLLSVNAQLNHSSVMHGALAGFAGGALLITSGRAVLFVYFLLAPIIGVAIGFAQPDPATAEVKVTAYLLINFAGWVIARYMYHYHAVRYRTFLRLEHRNREVQRELSIASVIQGQLAMPQSQKVGDMIIQTQARPTSKIGGDLFDLIEFEEEHLVGIFMADVLNDGVSAALVCTSIKSAVRSLQRSKYSPADMLRDLNGRIYKQIPGNHFGAIYGILDTRTNYFRFARAGLPYPLLVGSEQVDQLAGFSNVLGRPKRPIIAESEVYFKAGDLLVICSYGMSLNIMDLQKQFAAHPPDSPGAVRGVNGAPDNKSIETIETIKTINGIHNGEPPKNNSAIMCLTLPKN